MSTFIKSSIGQKLLMSLSGLFLIVFLLVHLGLNSLLLFDSTGELFNLAAHFMGTNPVMHTMEPLLAAGFIIHITYGAILTLQNQKARPIKYEKVDQSESSKWASRNMFVLGGLVFIFLIIHLANFFVKMKITGVDFKVTYNGEEMDNAYVLVTNCFNMWWYSVIYVIGAVLLGLHLSHGFWSAFQTIGLSNGPWRKRLTIVGNIYTIIVAGGFAAIPIFFLVKGLL